jgi:tRNA threonylcarbamoyladenosine modification (KEOPS) complex Cgi121 subunit
VTDADRLDYLEAIQRPRMGFTDIHLTGLRTGDNEATLFQIELPGKLTLSAASLRDAIDECSKKYPRVRM